jgi:hypothetical protein
VPNISRHRSPPFAERDADHNPTRRLGQIEEHVKLSLIVGSYENVGARHGLLGWSGTKAHQVETETSLLWA